MPVRFSLVNPIKRISSTFFDLFAIGTRRAITRALATELSWWSDLDGMLLGTVFLDTTDQDFNWIMLARDLVGRFRCVEIETSLRSERLACARLRTAMATKARDPAFTGFEAQGDEPKSLLDLFEHRGVPDSQLHTYYLQLRDEPAREPAKRVFQAIAPWLVTSDPHLVREFQESQFDQRLWEIYLWAMFRDQGYDVEHQVAPDLVVSSPWFSFSVEATTVAPSVAGPLANHPNPQTPEEVQQFLHDYMPMKFGSSLLSKLRKQDSSGRHYWDMPKAAGLPFVLAIADFHKPADGPVLGSMTYSQGALYSYLYGIRVRAEFVDGHAQFTTEPVMEHTYNSKIVPSGFFSLPDAENVSAVLFSNAATLAKFDRVGVLAGFAPPAHRYIRTGFVFDPDPDALVGIPFSIDITDPSYEEYWGDEVQFYHNPRAKRVIPPGAFPDAVHYFFEDGKLTCTDRPGRVLSSMTTILRPAREGTQKVA